ncbi:hypothetical protein IFM89_036442 [Coptis chinensis]|uniref:Cytochrome P450 n=1 Tax=Coptis chinensis TaxID=261450 RepID=A0A835LWF3_9MAGN|nr:hypothetical protein IFM89_036442 [Coptis chinensis]
MVLSYGDGVGVYRSHLFGSPAIIGCSPEFNKFVFQSHDLFPIKWPTIELLGCTSIVAVDGKSHTRIRSYVSNAINKPDALKRVTSLVQPIIINSLRSWAEKGQVKAVNEVKKITFGNIGSMFVSFKPGPLLDMLDQDFAGLLRGVRAQPSKLPGTAYSHAVQCRKRLMAVFRKELEKRKRSSDLSDENNDLMDGLIKMKDEEGKLLGDEEEENMAASKKGDFITREELAELKNTNKVVEETIRLANIAPIVFRVAKEDAIYQGYKIPKGWNVALWIRYIHTDPKNFVDPMSFDPERWNNPPKPGTYQVFGEGPRICAGNMLARIQLCIFLHHLVTGYKWELINPDAKITYLPHPRPDDGVEIAFSTL